MKHQRHRWIGWITLLAAVVVFRPLWSQTYNWVQMDCDDEEIGGHSGVVQDPNGNMHGVIVSDNGNFHEAEGSGDHHIDGNLMEEQHSCEGQQCTGGDHENDNQDWDWLHAWEYAYDFMATCGPVFPTL